MITMIFFSFLHVKNKIITAMKYTNFFYETTDSVDRACVAYLSVQPETRISYGGHVC
jgi:hypothetical protein